MGEVGQLSAVATRGTAPVRVGSTSVRPAAREGSTPAHPASTPAVSTTQVSVYAKDAVLRAGVCAGLRGSPLITLADRPVLDSGAVGVIVADVIDEDVLNGIRTIARVSTPRIVVVAGRLTPSAAAAALEAGAYRFLLRTNARPDRLTAAVRSAALAPRGPASLDEALGDAISELDEDPPAPPERPAGLSERDIEVLRLMAGGDCTARIADYLAYSESTIKNVIHAIERKLGARNRTHAVAIAVKTGLI